jgi:hypothetical protein
MHSTSSAGNVISIPLSSQLQTKVSFLQKSTKVAPNVRERVRQGRMWDVYLGGSGGVFVHWWHLTDNTEEGFY